MSIMTMRNRLRILASSLLAFFILISAAASWAITACPEPFKATQPDGSVVTLLGRGDEHFHWIETLEGFTVVRDSNGAYVYASLDAKGELASTGLLVGQADPKQAGLGRKILPASDVLSAHRKSSEEKLDPAHGMKGITPTGIVKNIVILMRFSDHGARTLPTNGNFSTIMNAVGGDPVLAPTGSVRDFYFYNSYGALSLDSTVYGWVTLPHTEAYYANGQSGLDGTTRIAITDALALADPMINFSNFDSDSDGFVDAIAFIHSGYGGEYSGEDQYGTPQSGRIWSHKGSLSSPWSSAEGVKVSPYHINPGLWQTSGSEPGRMGVIVHETGHFFGLPDLYDYGQETEGIGNWCVMAGGSWGFLGDQLHSSHFSAWSKYALGWINPTVITAAGTYTAPQSATNPNVFIIRAGYPADEYLLIENRQAVGFETAIPQAGIAIWHIDDNKDGNNDEGYPGQSGWPQNNKHYQVALMQADGEYDLEHGRGRGDSGDLYHGNGPNQFGSLTVPNSNGYQGGTNVVTNHNIHSISASASTMTFEYSQVAPPTPTPIPTPENNDCSLATVICTDTLYQASTGLATIDGASCTFGGPAPDIWFRYSPETSGTAIFSLCGSTYDTVMSVHTGCPGSDLNRVACDDDAHLPGCGTQTQLSVPVTGGASYWIRVSGYGGETGTVNFMTTGPPCAADPIPQGVELRNDDLSLVGNRGNWLGGLLAGAGSAFTDVAGLCMSAPLMGNNVIGWVYIADLSEPGYVTLVDGNVWRARTHVASTEGVAGTTPLFDFVYKNEYFAHDANLNISEQLGYLTYGGDFVILDNADGANAPGYRSPTVGRDSYDFWLSPIAMLLPQWKGTVDPADSAFAPREDVRNDMSFAIRLLDLDAAGINAAIDVGTVCVSRIEIDRVALSALWSENDTPVYGPPLTSTLHSPMAFEEDFDQIYSKSYIDDTTHVAHLRLAGGGGPGSRKTIFPYDTSKSDILLQLYPVAWASNKLYLIEMDATADPTTISGEPAPNDTNPPSLIEIIGFQPSIENLVSHVVLKGYNGSPKTMYRAGTPRLPQNVGNLPQRYIGLYYTHNRTVNTGANSDRIGPRGGFFNPGVLGGVGEGLDRIAVSKLAMYELPNVP